MKIYKLIQDPLNGLSLLMDGFKKPFSIDFSYSFWQKRRNAGRNQGLVQACKPGSNTKIIDATAGWGRDAAILASFGAKVIMLERNIIMQQLLQDALNRARKLPKHMDLQLETQDAIAYLESLKEVDYPDIIYLDPMHPTRHKSALVKKDMQALRSIVAGEVDDFLLLLETALKRAKKVVVKWPQKQLAYLTPTRVVNGKVVRFDIYDCFLV